MSRESGAGRGQGRPAVSFFARGDAWAVLAGAFAIGLALAVRWVVGEAYSNYEARVLLKSMVAGGLYLASSLTGASATIIALMLTVLGLARNTKHFSDALYGQIRWISIISATVLAGSIVALLMMSVPLTHADNLPRGWIKGLYYAISALLATSSGAMVALVVMLLTAVLGIIRVVAPDADVGASSDSD